MNGGADPTGSQPAQETLRERGHAVFRRQSSTAAAQRNRVASWERITDTLREAITRREKEAIAQRTPLLPSVRVCLHGRGFSLAETTQARTTHVDRRREQQGHRRCARTCHCRCRPATLIRVGRFDRVDLRDWLQ